jgi:glutathione S-transferase
MRTMNSAPVLYSFRRCPYAIRARLALRYAGIAVEHREVQLRDKPAEMLAVSPKGTVPVLVLADGTVIDESVDIMRWALVISDPDGWRAPPAEGETDALIAANDGPFKASLDRYKYSDRHPERPEHAWRDETHEHLAALDATLQRHEWLHGKRMGLADAALFPFVRQFAMVDLPWFRGTSYAGLVRWLDQWLEHPLFLSVMDKHEPWRADQAS